MRRAWISPGLIGGAPLCAIALACLAASCTSRSRPRLHSAEFTGEAELTSEADFMGQASRRLARVGRHDAEPLAGEARREGSPAPGFSRQDERGTKTPNEEPLGPGEPTSTSPWTITLRPYLWVPAMHGEVAVRGASAPVAVNTSEAFDLLKDLESAFVLHGEIAIDRFRLFGDVNYLSLEASEATPAGRIDAEFTQAFSEAGIAYELAREDLGNGWQLVAEPLAGARFQYLDLEIELRGAGRQGSGDEFWVDAFGGLRFRLGEERGFGIVGRFDAGGGGSRAAWNALAGIDWSIAGWLGLSAGYRWLSIDYASGSGGSRTEYDLLLLGPFVGLTLRF